MERPSCLINRTVDSLSMDDGLKWIHISRNNLPFDSCLKWKKKKKDHYGDCVLLRLSKPQNLIQRAANLKENQDKLENQDIS